MRSMTGYSKLNYEDENYVINMEIKSVNNKNLATKIKLPYNLNLLESFIRGEIASLISRGSIDFRIEFENKNESLKNLKYDENLAKSCMDILNKMEEDFNDKFSNKLDFLVRNFGVISQKDLETDEEKYKEIIDLKLKELLHNFIKTKVEEGNRLRNFFKEQLNILKLKVEEVKKLNQQPCHIKVILPSEKELTLEVPKNTTIAELLQEVNTEQRIYSSIISMFTLVNVYMTKILYSYKIYVHRMEILVINLH